MANDEKAVKNRILLVGGGGHCRSVIDAVISGGQFQEIGIVDRTPGEVLGIPVVGGDEDLPGLFEQGWSHAFVSLGSVGDPSLRKKLYYIIQETGFKIPAIVDPSAVVAKSARLAAGIFVGKRAVVNSNVTVGTGAIVNTGSIVEHDCCVGAFAHISPGAVLCGNVRVDDDCHVGAGAIVKQQIHIGSGTLVGAGSVVLRDIPERKVAYGNPCRVVKDL